MNRHRPWHQVVVGLVVWVLVAACSSAQVASERSAADVPPLPDLVKPLEGRTTKPAMVMANAWMAFCKQWLTGWDVDFDKTPIGVITIHTDQPGFDFATDREVTNSCLEEGEAREHLMTDTREAERGTYQTLVTQHECLVEVGVPLLDDRAGSGAPSFEEHVELGWDPFNDIDRSQLDSSEIVDAYEACGEDRSFELKGIDD